MSIPEELQSEAARIIDQARLPGSHLGQLLNSFLNRFLVWPYRATPGLAVDSGGAESDEFDSLIYTSSTDLERVPADTLACAIDVHLSLDLEKLTASYEKISKVKALKKTPPARLPSGTPQADATMGIILAVDSIVPLEEVAETMEVLNKKHSHEHWVDMVVVLSRGVVNYACQLPYQLLADWLPPARGVVADAPLYIHLFAMSGAQLALNKMCTVLFSYLQFFSPGAAFPNLREIMESSPKTGMTIAPYQFNLKGQLVRVRLEQFLVFPIGFRAADDKGNELARVQYLPWQDGGVVRTSGKLPLEAFLVFAGDVAKRAQKFRLSDGELSSVLPLSRERFIEMAKRVAAQSNLVITPDEPPKWVVEKHAGEGTASPYVARLFLGILRMRDQCLSGATERERFDKAFEGVRTGLDSIREASQRVVEVFSSHAKRVASGEVARMVGRSIHVDESIDRELRKQVDSVISGAGRVVKDRMQELLRTLDLDIGFLSQKQGAFQNGIRQLRQQSPNLAGYLEETRAKWSERLNRCRTALEHEGWVLPKVRHVEDSGRVRAIEPLIDGQPATEFVVHIVDRVCCFVEEMSMFALQAHMPEGVSITEIPVPRRKPDIKERFQLALVGGGMPIWSIAYHESQFEET